MALSFEDRINAEHEIEKIVYGYADALDTGDFDRLGEYFRRGKVRVDGVEAVYEGTDGVLGMFRSFTRFYDGIPSTKHVTTNLRIEVDESGQSATAKSYFTVLQARPELPLQIVIAGRYADTFERVEGKWYLTDRFEYCDLIGNLVLTSWGTRSRPEPRGAGMETFNPFDVSSTHHLWERSAELRRNQPVARLASGVVYVSRYGDARAVLRKPQVFSSQGGFKADGVEIPIGDASLGDFDEPEHGPVRRLAMAAAGPSRVEGERQFALESARRLVAALARDGGTRDVVAALALPLSSEVTAHLLGAPVEDAGRLYAWAEDIMHSELPVYLRTSRGVGYHGAFPEYAAFVDNLIDERLDPADRHDDAIKRIVDAIVEDRVAGAMPAKDVIFMIVSTLLLGGVTTTRDLIGWLLYELVRKPELYGAVASDRSLIPAAVEEVLRFYPPLLYLMRKCIVDTDIDGFAISAGERVLVGIASANRDEAVYPSADEFRLDRQDPPPQLTFGHGLHMCVGHALARMEAEVLLEAFLDEFDVTDVSVAPAFELELMPAPFMYGPVSVDVVVERVGRRR